MFFDRYVDISFIKLAEITQHYFFFFFWFPIPMVSQVFSCRLLTRSTSLTLYRRIQRKCSYVNDENERKQFRNYHLRISITSRKKQTKIHQFYNTGNRKFVLIKHMNFFKKHPILRIFHIPYPNNLSRPLPLHFSIKSRLKQI